VPNRIWDGEPEMRSEANAERKRHRGPNGHDEDAELGEWDAGDDDEDCSPASVAGE
jgi:hypothetical protein